MKALSRRTPPGVRELKLDMALTFNLSYSRTPPGVRELKQSRWLGLWVIDLVAPLPGCVN